MGRIKLIGIVAAVAVVWWGGIALAAVALLVPSKADFQVAADDVEQIRKTADPIGEAFQEYLVAISAHSREGKSYAEIVSSTAEQRNKLEKAIGQRKFLDVKLSKSKVLHDKEVYAPYMTFAVQEASYLSYTESYAKAYPAFSSSFNSCADIYDISRKARAVSELPVIHKAAATDCLQELDILAASENRPLSAYGKTLANIVRERQKTFEAVAADELDITAAGAKIKELAAASKANDPLKGIEEARKNAGFNGELTALSDILTRKAQ